MRLTVLSDLHGYFPKLPGGDILILAGDYTARDSDKCWESFFSWLHVQDFAKKIIVGGNHDVKLESWSESFCGWDDREVYLCDSLTKCSGLKIWGSPWTKNFDGQNPQAMAFGLTTEKELEEKFSLIPHDVDILITHSPPFGILDAVAPHQKRRCGSKALLEAVHRVRPAFHFFGHIHECGGKSYETGGTKFYNVAYVNSRYRPRNKILTLEI